MASGCPSVEVPRRQGHEAGISRHRPRESTLLGGSKQYLVCLGLPGAWQGRGAQWIVCDWGRKSNGQSVAFLHMYDNGNRNYFRQQSQAPKSKLSILPPEPALLGCRDSLSLVSFLHFQANLFLKKGSYKIVSWPVLMV